MRTPLLSAIPLALVGTLALWAGPPDLPSKPVADFTLADLSGKPWSLGDQKSQNAVVIVFLGTECPVSNAYVSRMNELAREFGPQGVAFVGVNANCHDTPAAVAAHARDNGITFPMLKDVTGTVAERLGARRTPEAFLLDGEHRVVYHGRIDDQFGPGFKRVKATRRDLAEAVTQLLAGKPVSVTSTPAQGAIIDRANSPKADGPVTYTKQVARILEKKCQNCHRPGQVGPMSLLNYEDALAWSETIQEAVGEERMPPWHADPGFGSFANDRRLSPAERATLLAWIDGGCPKGDEKELPPPKEFPEGWAIGQPDAVYGMHEPYKVPASVGPQGLEYQYFVVPTHFERDVWVQAAEARPGNKAIVHHIIVYVRDPKHKQSQEDGVGDSMLAGYAPGEMPVVLAPGTARKIPKGSELVFQMHYTPNGAPGEDQSSVGLIFARAPVKHEVRTRAIESRSFVIPPRAKDYTVTSSTLFRGDVELLGLTPHMHLRGKDFEYKAVFPDGHSLVLLRVPRYDFGWQVNYRLRTPMRLPRGTRVECTAHFDNSAGNPNNPDPNKKVSWGEQTWDEMMVGFVDYSRVR